MYYKWVRKSVAVCLVPLLLGGCLDEGGGDSSTSSSTPSTPSGVDASTSGYYIYLPNGVSTVSAQGDFDGVFAFAGASSLQSATGAAGSGVVSVRDVAGFVAQTTPLNFETSASQLLDTYQSAISSHQDVYSFSTTSRREGPYGSAASGVYVVTTDTYNASTPTAVINEIATVIGINKDFGVIHNLPEPVQGEHTSTSYVISIGVLFSNNYDVLLAVAVVPVSVENDYRTIVGYLADTSNITTKDKKPITRTDSFVTSAGSAKSDFLFVIDNSGSMSNEQNAISTAATEFTNALTSSGLDYSIATITTDSDTPRDTYGDGETTTNLAEFALDVKPGTYGSTTESGLYFAERALESISMGDIRDGTLTNLGFPRPGASLSLVFMSDEPDFYDSYNYSATFDTASNLFVDRGYKAYSIVDTGTASYDRGDDYIDLSTATGGSYADIGDTTTFGSIMRNIAVGAGATASSYKLTQSPISSSIKVSVNGVPVVNSTVNGWSYYASSNSVVFFGSSLPQARSTVEVRYSY